MGEITGLLHGSRPPLMNHSAPRKQNRDRVSRLRHEKITAPGLGGKPSSSRSTSVRRFFRHKGSEKKKAFEIVEPPHRNPVKEKRLDRNSKTSKNLVGTGKGSSAPGQGPGILRCLWNWVGAAPARKGIKADLIHLASNLILVSEAHLSTKAGRSEHGVGSSLGGDQEGSRKARGN